MHVSRLACIDHSQVHILRRYLNTKLDQQVVKRLRSATYAPPSGRLPELHLSF